MPHLTVAERVDRAGRDRICSPRHDVVEERAGGDGLFVLAHGPFARYRRTVQVTTDDGAVDRFQVTQRFDYRLPAGTWRFLMNHPIRRALRQGPRPDGRLPWWYPPQRPDARAASVLGMLAALSLVAGYHGTLLTQTMSFAADEFGAGTTAQGGAFGAVRVGALLGIVLGALADRRGRRLLLVASLLASIGATAAGALAPDLPALAATQLVNRGTATTAAVLLTVIAAEEMPPGARAYALSLLSMTGALGAGMALWVLPVADLGLRAWRILYVVPLAFVPLVLRLGRLIPESRRYERPHRTVPLAGHYHRLALLAGAALLLYVFTAPQSQFRTEFLRDERGMSALAVSLFVMTTSTPAGIGVVIGGRLADLKGRRAVGAVAASVGAVLLALSFTLAGPAMWLAATLGSIFTAALVPALGVYGPELFPTSLRGRANGIITTVATVGSVSGLVVAGLLVDELGSFGWALGLLAIGPLAMAAVVLLLFPETAWRELEDLNPEDRPAAAPGGVPVRAP
ncbi:MAG TPA: MFS transporter [Acidimicrobiales bacterium]|nr:MFS transporter [Acidimicrobiales bacterium]